MHFEQAAAHTSSSVAIDSTNGRVSSTVRPSAISSRICATCRSAIGS
ncbi:hypothetical protein FB565_007135 [Actinoplanes lutulentus]|nr:hypothetical protein [Actinoplanes lutulentus]MBB2947367.1 hypothetical protein [Actinoplanes lutulentus]